VLFSSTDLMELEPMSSPTTGFCLAVPNIASLSASPTGLAPTG
jgi:hypothetical protein